jgi:acyl-CoA thioester hydrolase
VTDADGRDLLRADFDHIVTLTTRWSDNDAYGHLNNAVYLQLFDTAITGWLAEGVGSAVTALPAQGVVVESRCRYLRELAYPSAVHAAVGLERLGRTSVSYRVGVFAAERDEIAALGHWVHVYVDPQSRRPVAIPDPVRGMLEAVLEARARSGSHARG